MEAAYLNVDTSVPTWDDRFEPVIKWLNAYNGKGSYTLGGFKVFFSHEEDAIMFKLRWLGD